MASTLGWNKMAHPKEILLPPKRKRNGHFLCLFLGIEIFPRGPNGLFRIIPFQQKQ
jgi:hypothetical protein